MEWDDIGCGYGEALTVVDVDGESFTGILVDFEMDFDGSYGEDSITIKIEGRLPIEFKESEIAEVRPFGVSGAKA